SPYVLHTDAQGSVRAITDSLAKVVETYGYDEFGAPLFTYSASTPNNAAAQPLHYTGEPRDPETGFVYLRARMYDPTIGRFLQRDPKPLKSCDVRRPMSLSRYAYAEDNPATQTDHSGLEPRAMDSPAECGVTWDLGFIPDPGQFVRGQYRNGGNTLSFLLAMGNLVYRYAPRPGASAAEIAIAKTSFVRQVAWCFAGISKEGDFLAALNNGSQGGHIRFMNQSDLVSAYRDPDLTQDQTHHWAAFFALGYVNYPLAVLRANIDLSDPGDRDLGILGGAQGRDFGLGSLGFDDLVRVLRSTLWQP
ncbi:MAG: hypothetical protein QOF51_1659, partial [Chloroflexota bacterium]|nr:hypothetical protein [Chloroflexota bacterium]